MIYPIPKDALDDRLAVVGTAGSGKTYLTLGAAEHLLARKSRIIFVDPLGVAWGLRLCEDGKTASPFQPVIFGGAHGDLPINEHAGALIGEAVATMRESCIIDLSQLGTKAAERRFMLAFLTALYRHTNKEPVHLIIDEADMFAPQKLLDKDGDAAKLLGMMETVVRRGRARGFIPWLLTQRPAVISKDVLSQADGVVALKLTAAQDRKAIAGWVESTADTGQWKAIDARLPTFQQGQGVLWIPGRGILREVAFPPKATFDSSRTPKRGEKRHTAELKPLDLGALKDRLATVESETKANDPKVLKAQLATAQAELAKLRKSANQPSNPAEKVNAADQKAWERAVVVAVEVGAEEIRQRIPNMLDAQHQASFKSGFDFLASRKAVFEPDFISPRRPILAIGSAITAKVTASTAASPMSGRAQPAPAPRPTTRAPAAQSQAADGLPTPHRRVLASLSFWASVGHEAPTREQVAGVAGYSPGSGGYNNILGALSTAGMIDKPQAGRVALAAGAPSIPMDADEAKAKLLSVLTGPEKKVVDSMAGGEAMTRDEVAEASGYSAGSGGFNNIIGHLNTLCVLTKPGQGTVQLSDWAREVLG